jgi:hypothetical protein
MNHTYKIHRWDSVIFDNKTLRPIPAPIIYIKPDKNLIKFAEENSNQIVVKIYNSIYDTRYIPGKWLKSSDIPNYRPIFFDETELYVIVLQDHWTGYPESLGECEIYGLTGGVSAKTLNNVNLTKPDTSEKEKEKEKDKSSFMYVYGLLILLFILLGLSMLI